MVLDTDLPLNAGVHPNFVMAIEVYVQMLRAQASVTFRIATLIRYSDIDTATPAGRHADAIATVSLNFDNMVIVNCSRWNASIWICLYSHFLLLFLA